MRKKLVSVLISILLIMNQICSKSKKAGTEKVEKDLRLSEIDRLIRRTEYDEALKLLNVYIVNNPQNFDNAQIRIKRIMNARIEYAKLAEKLIHIILTEPENNQKIYEITAQLEKFERHPSDANLQFIADVKKSAEFNYFRAQFMDIQNSVAALAAQENYVAAFEKAKTGFWLYKDNYYEKWEDTPAFINGAETILAGLDKNIAVYEGKDFLTKLNDAVHKFIVNVDNDNYREAENSFKDVYKNFVELNNVRKNLQKTSGELASLFEETKAVDMDATDASFLPFMMRFVSGIDTIEDSGLTGVIDRQWKTLVGRMNDAVFRRVSAVYGTYCNSESGNAVVAANIKNYAVLENSVINLYDIQNVYGKDGSIEYVFNPYADYKIQTAFIQNLVANVERLRNVQQQILEIEGRQQNLLVQFENSGAKKSDVIAGLFGLTANLGNIAGIESEQRLENCSWSSDYNKLNSHQWDVLCQKYTQLLESVFVQVNQMDVVSWNRIAAYYDSLSDSYVAEAEAYNSGAERYNHGFYAKIDSKVKNQITANAEKAVELVDSYETDPELDFGFLFCYPDVAKKIADAANARIEGYIAELSETQTNLMGVYGRNGQWKENQEVTQIVNENQLYLEENKAKLAALKVQSGELAVAAQNKILAAQLARNEADLRFEEAESALKKNSYALARKKLQDALTKYDESLNSQNDEKLRADCDKKLQALGERITRGENEYVVVEVRNLKTLAKDAYFNGRFEDAEKYLNQAKIRWADTNAIDDPEITNLMTFVSAAVSMKTDREILPSSPQYPEMSQLLDISYQYYNSGSEKYAAGNKTEGNKDLDKALESIQKLQYVYPLNQEASLLTLKINRLKDPVKFREELGQKIEAARFMCRGNDTRREGYANLLDYYELEPDYKGLKQLIYQTEIDIGIRQKPVDNSGEKKALSLLNEAKKLFNSAGNDRSRLEQALAKVNESLALNGNDKTAAKLKDDITVRIGGSASTVLSTEDERMYQLAIQRLQNNNIPGANVLVEQLLKKPGNQYSQKIKDLKVKIDARS